MKKKNDFGIIDGLFTGDIPYEQEDGPMARSVLCSMIPASLLTKGFLCSISWLAFSVHAVSAVTANLIKSDAGASALVTASAWEGGSEIFPDPSVDYYVGANLTLKTERTVDITFSGRSLVLGDVEKDHYAVLGMLTSDTAGDRVLQFTGEGGLVLNRGALDNWNSCCTVVSGEVTVASTASHPFLVYSGTAPNFSKSERDANMQLEGVLQSGESAMLAFYSSIKGEDVTKTNYRIMSDISQFKGTILVAQASKSTSTSRNRIFMEIVGGELGGEMQMESRTTLEVIEPGSVLTMKRLTLKRGSALSLRWDAASDKGCGIAVEDALSIEGPVEVRPSRLNASYDDDGFSVALLKAPQGVSLSADDFVFVASVEGDVDEFITPVVFFEVVADADGRDVLWAKSLPIKRSGGGDAKNSTCSFCYDPTAPASNWPEGKVAEPGYDYVASHSMRSLMKAGMTAVFPGHSLTFKSTSTTTLALLCPLLVVPDFRIDLSSGSLALDNYGNGDKTINAFASRGTIAIEGKMKILSDSSKENRLYIYPGDKGLIRIDSDISGNGSIDVKMTGTDANTHCYLELAGDNSKWSGRLYASKKPTDENSYACIFFREAKNLGGSMGDFSWRGIHLGNSGRLHPLQSVTLNESTRGVYVAGAYCRIEVDEDIDFTLCQRISYEGTLTKTGAGTFALGGGRPLFEGSLTAPRTEGKNRLNIAEGAFTPLSSDPFDGIAISFAEGTRIALAVPENYDEGVGKWGMALTNEYSSIALPADGIPVALAAGTQPPSRKFAIPVCTVRSDDAAALRGKFILENRRPFPWHLSEIIERDNADGTVTFVLSTSRTGFAVGIR